MNIWLISTVIMVVDLIFTIDISVKGSGGIHLKGHLDSVIFPAIFLSAF